MKKRMRFLAVAALSLAMTTAYGQQGQAGSSQGSKSSTGTEYQKDKTGTQSQKDRTGTQSQPGTKSSTQSGQGMGMGTAEERVKSEVSWMKSEFNLDQNQEKKLHDVLLKYDKHDATSGQGASSTDVAKNKEAKEKEIKAIIGDQNFEIYKQKKAEKKSGTSGQGTVDPASRERSSTDRTITSPSSTSPSSTSPSSTSPSSTSPSSTSPSSTSPSSTSPSSTSPSSTSPSSTSPSTTPTP
jgi:hypothetical protein